MRKAVLLGLVIVLALAALAAAGCGGGTDQNAVATVQANLDKIDAAVKDLTAKGIAGTLTVADIKVARDTLKPEVQSVIDNGKKIKGVNTDTVQKAWTDLDTAVSGLSDSATLADAAGVLMAKVTPLTTALAEVRTAVTAATK